MRWEGRCSPLQAPCCAVQAGGRACKASFFQLAQRNGDVRVCGGELRESGPLARTALAARGIRVY